MQTEVTTTPAAAVEVVRSFVNTLDLEDGVDVLGRSWLEDRGLLARHDDLTEEELARLGELREVIRELLAANTGVATDVAEAAAALDRAAAGVALGVRFRPDGTTAVQAGAESGERATGRMLAVLAAATTADEWPRLKACRRDDCRWAFVDESRNRSRVWCSMAACGNRAKARAYRARH